MTRTSTSLYIVSVSCLCLVFTTSAAWWNPVSWFKKKGPQRAETLVITGNYVKSRLLAELIQFKSKQPILLLPTGNESDIMFFLTPTEETLEVKKDDYLKFIHFLDPKRVLFLGNELYTPSSYIEQLTDHLPVWSVTNNDWEKIALSVEELLKIKHLEYDYLVLLHQLDDKGHLKPAASTETIGGYTTRGRYWNPEE